MPLTIAPCSRKLFLIAIVGITVPLLLALQLVLEMTRLTSSLASAQATLQEAAAASLFSDIMITRQSRDAKTEKVKRNQDLPIWQYNNPFFVNATRDAFCHGCRTFMKAKMTPPCWNRKAMPTLNSRLGGGNNLSAAAAEDLIPPPCRAACLGCPEADRWYGRLDEAFPPVRRAVSHFLPSIPDKHRLPRNVSTWREYFGNPAVGHPRRTYLVEYNPSLVRIPTRQIPAALAGDGVVYLASFRVTSRQYCHADADMALAMLGRPGTGGVWPKSLKRPTYVDQLGLALLRDDLSIVADAVYNLQGHGNFRLQDSRIFVLHDQLYWSPGQLLHPIWLVPPSESSSTVVKVPARFYNSSSSSTWSSSSPSSSPPSLWIDKRGICAYPVGSNKNLQFFVDPTDGAVVAEFFPMGQKAQLDVSQRCPASIVGSRPVDLQGKPPTRSFGTVDEVRPSAVAPVSAVAVLFRLLTHSYKCAPFVSAPCS